MSAFAKSVVTALSALASPIGAAVKRRLVKRKVRKSIERVSLKFVTEYPATADAMADSADAVARELARLAGAGRPVDAPALAERWAATGRLSQDDARWYAGEYVQRLHDELLKIDGFQALFEAGASVTTAEIVRRIEASARADDERKIAVLYFEAAKAYFAAALALLDGDAVGAMRWEYDARSLIDTAKLGRASLALVNSKEVRQQFAELVEDRFEAAEAACATGDREMAQAGSGCARRGLRGVPGARQRARARELAAAADSDDSPSSTGSTRASFSASRA